MGTALFSTSDRPFPLTSAHDWFLPKGRPKQTTKYISPLLSVVFLSHPKGGLSACVRFDQKSGTKNPDLLSQIRILVVEVTGFEPATFWSRTKRATKLRYTSNYGANEGTRTLDLRFTKPLLCQLSHIGRHCQPLLTVSNYSIIAGCSSSVLLCLI